MFYARICSLSLSVVMFVCKYALGRQRQEVMSSQPACSAYEQERRTDLLSYAVILFQVNFSYYNKNFKAGKASVVISKHCQIY